MSEMKTVTRDRMLVDTRGASPVDRHLAHTRRAWLLVLLVVVVIVALWFVWRFQRDVPVRHASAEAHFKYGSIGSEPGGDLLEAIGGVLPPRDVFKALPDICPDLLPGGYASLGFIYEPGRDLPIGISERQRLGFKQAGLNCAVCHTGTVRARAGSAPQTVLGMPAHGLDLQRFFRFVTACTLDPRFTADNVIGRMRAGGAEVGALDRLLYRMQVIPRTREATLAMRDRVEPLLASGAAQWGLGRVDTFNPYKALQFNWQLTDLPASELVGASDYPALWNQKPREGMQLHWDGNNDSVDERNLSASLGTGVTPVTIDHAGLKRVRDWLWTLPPPPYPFTIDATLAARGAAVYRTQCMACHGDHRFKQGGFLEPGTRVGKVLPLAEIGTDPYRLHSYTLAFASNQYTLYPGSAYQFKHFRKTDGYAMQPLDGIWARAPYLHNGSVPTMRDLLDPPDARPKVFYRGYDVYDQERLGFVDDVSEEGSRRYFRYDTSAPGNGNGGHDYGTALPPADKRAVVEYLKTF